MSTPTPECDKIITVSEAASTIGTFLEWLLYEKGYVFAEFEENLSMDDRLVSARVDIQRLLAEYFNIDLDKAEQERMVILDELRRQQDES